MKVTAALLLTEAEVIEYAGLSVDSFKKAKFKPAGSFTPPKSRPIPLYARSEVDRYVRKLVTA